MTHEIFESQETKKQLELKDGEPEVQLIDHPFSANQT